MLLEDIQKLWEEDSKISKTDLGIESLKIPRLHNKYYKVFINEKLNLIKLESEYKTLKFQKYEFYVFGADEETKNKGWKLPPCGKILKSEVENYLQADKDIINHCLKISLQKEKVTFLTSIITSITYRNTLIRASIDWARFQSGA